MWISLSILATIPLSDRRDIAVIKKYIRLRVTTGWLTATKTAMYGKKYWKGLCLRGLLFFIAHYAHAQQSGSEPQNPFKINVASLYHGCTGSQTIINPSANPEADNALAMGLRLILSL